MKKFFICFILLAGAMFMQAQVRRTPAQRTQTQQPSTVVVKETEPLIVNGHLAFLGIPVKQSRVIVGNLLKGKGFLQKDDGYGNIRWEGTAFGVKSSVALLGGYEQGTLTEGISYRELKNYSKTQARNRVNAYLNAFLKATNGKVIENTMANNGIEGEYVEIQASNGYIKIEYGNQDEVNFDSPYYDVIVLIRED